MKFTTLLQETYKNDNGNEISADKVEYLASMSGSVVLVERNTQVALVDGPFQVKFFNVKVAVR